MTAPATFLFRLNERLALSADDRQWILMRSSVNAATREEDWRPIAFIASTKGILERASSSLATGPLQPYRPLRGCLETELRSAWQAHYQKFPGGRSSDEQRKSLAEVQKIEFALKEAQERVTQLETAGGRHLLAPQQ